MFIYWAPCFQFFPCTIYLFPGLILLRKLFAVLIYGAIHWNLFSTDSTINHSRLSFVTWLILAALLKYKYFKEQFISNVRIKNHLLTIIPLCDFTAYLHALTLKTIMNVIIICIIIKMQATGSRGQSVRRWLEDALVDILLVVANWWTIFLVFFRNDFEII